MAAWKLTIEYEGTDFAGWQVQPDARTVQGELARALEIVLREPVRVTGAGRTDAGVHALGQVAAVACEADLAAALRGVNAVLPDDVVVRSAVPAPESFHPRFDAVRRHYRYRLHRGPTALERRTTWTPRPFPDVNRLAAAAARLPGHRDFASFASEVEPDETTMCRLERVDVSEQGDLVLVEVTANRFLRKMVRTLVGTLLEVGRDRRPVEWLDEVVAARDRRAAGPVVPPTGLFLVAVEYPGDGPEEENR
ncbi:MAG: tRNA pseudouridine(38-40) synthase TruA [bacterium]